jgi:hypothetical protein
MATTKRLQAEPQSGHRKIENPAQYQRFREVAREHQTDQSEEAFERAFQAIVRHRKRRSTGQTDE